MNQDPVLAVAVRAARRAGSIIIDAARDLKRLPSHAKGHRDIAGAAAAEARKAIIATLRAAFPAHAILGDDAGGGPAATAAAGAANAYRWIVEPIDGAANFAHGFPFYAVSIALTHGDDITHAAVLDPVRDELFIAITGKGAELNGAPIRVTACTSLADALIGTVFPARESPTMPAYLPVFSTLIVRCGGLRRAGACALDLAHVAAGRLDGFWTMSLQPWDVAAGALLVREAGGRIGDFAGGGEVVHSGEVIAAAPGVFNSLRESIAAAVPG